MAITYRMDRARRLAVIRLQGALTMEELETNIQNLAREPGFGPELRQLALMEATSASLNLSALAGFRKSRERQPRSRQIAVVAVSDFAYDLACQYALGYKQPDQEIRVFRDLAAACAWLGLSAEDAEAVGGMRAAAAL